MPRLLSTAVILWAMLTGRDAGRLLGMGFVAAIMLSASWVDAAERRGAFAFQYAPRLTDEQIAWYSRFEVLVTHDPLPAEQVHVLREAGTKLLFYEWAVAFYESRASAWQGTLLEDAKGMLINARPLRGGVGSTTAAAWYFDPAAEGFAEARAYDLVRRLDASGYDGVFFDTTRFESVHADAQQEYARRHPDLSYDDAFARFLAVLHKRLGAKVLFTNQGYRSAEQYLPHVQWDLTESLLTRPQEGRAALRPWNDAKDPWNSILHVMRAMIEPVARDHPNVRLAHLNYIDAPAPEVVRAAVAVAQLFGGEAFVAGATLEQERDAIYFRDPGTPTTPRIDWPGDAGAHRFFDRGLIAISASKSAMTIETNGRTFRNHFTGELACGGKVIIPPSPAGTTAWFFDRDDTRDCADHERTDPLP